MDTDMSRELPSAATLMHAATAVIMDYRRGNVNNSLTGTGLIIERFGDDQQSLSAHIPGHLEV
jgi:hypothetical protein